MTPDLIIIGGGAIGLSLADCALRAGLRVTILDKGPVAREASWAGAGMLTCRPWPKQRPEQTDIHDLTLLSVRLHAEWSARLKDETGIDTGYRVCGALELLRPGARELAQDDPEQEGWPRERLDRLITGCNARGVRARLVDAAVVRDLEPQLALGFDGAVEFPDEAQIRNPWFVRALHASVLKLGGCIREGVEVIDIDWDSDANRVCGVILKSGEKLAAGRVAVCAGAWAGQLPSLVTRFPAILKVEPVRGQLLCYQTDPQIACRLLTIGNHYIVPRGDGILLVGATHEHVGFDKSTTAQGRDELQSFAYSVLPKLQNVELLTTWAGLRPGLKGRHPLIGPVPNMDGVYLAAGHYRNGLTLAPATAQVIVNNILRITPSFSASAWLPI